MQIELQLVEHHSQDKNQRNKLLKTCLSQHPLLIKEVIEDYRLLIKHNYYRVIRSFDRMVDIDHLQTVVRNYNIAKYRQNMPKHIKKSIISNKVQSQTQEHQQFIDTTYKSNLKHSSLVQRNKRVKGKAMDQLVNECRRIERLLDKYEKSLNIQTDMPILELLKTTVMNISQIQQNVELRVQKIKDKIEVKHHKQISKYLNSQDRYGNSGLILCCQTNIDQSESREKCVEILLENGVEVNIRNQFTGWSAIFWICYWGDRQKANTLIMDRDGYYPIDIAGLAQNQQLVMQLIEHTVGIFVNIESNNHDYSIKYHNQHGKQKSNKIDPIVLPISFLVKSTFLRQTLFHWAIQFGSKTCLLDRLVDHNFYLFMPYFKQNNKNLLVSSAKYNYKQIQDLKINQHNLQNMIEKQIEKYKKYLDGYKSGFMFNVKGNELGEEFKMKYENIDWGFKARKMIRKYDKWVLNFSKSCMAMASYSYSSKTVVQLVKQKYSNLQDNYGNTPLHYANSIEDIGFIDYFVKQWECNIDVENREGFKAREFSSTKFVLNYYKDIMNIKKQNTNQKLQQENIRVDFVIKFNKHIPQLQQYLSKFIKITTQNNEKQVTEKDQIERINLYLDILIKNFNVYLMESADQHYIYAMINIDEEEMLKQAERYEVKLKLLNGEDYKVFTKENYKEFAPIRSKERQEIILTVINKQMDLDLLIRQYLVSSYYPVHDKEWIKTIKGLQLSNLKIFKQNIKDFIWGGSKAQFKTVTRINQYFGSAYSFLYAWQSFNAYQLLIRIFVPAIAVFVIIQMHQGENDHLCEMVMIGWVLYVIIMMMVIIYRWESKVYEINARLGTLGYFYQKKDIQSVCRKDWRRDDIIQVDTLEYTQKEFDSNIQFTRLKKTVCYILMGLMFAFAVSLSLYINLDVIQGYQEMYDNILAIQMKKQKQRQKIDSKLMVQKNEMYRYIIIFKVIDQVIIQFFNQIYKIFTNIAIDLENHKYDVQLQYQRSTYIFYAIFMTSNLPIVVRYVITFYRTSELEISEKNEIFAQNLLTQLLAQAASQFGMNIVFNVLYYKWMKMSYFKLVHKQASLQQKGDPEEQSYERVVLTFNKESNNYEFVSNIDVDSIELDSLKNPVTDDELTLIYTNSMVKLSYCMMFACYFHLGVPILVIIYILELQFINIYLAKYRRRTFSQIQVDIQNWSQIQRILVKKSILSNCFFIFGFGVIEKYRDNMRNYLISWLKDQIEHDKNFMHKQVFRSIQFMSYTFELKFFVVIIAIVLIVISSIIFQNIKCPSWLEALTVFIHKQHQIYKTELEKVRIDNLKFYQTNMSKLIDVVKMYRHKIHSMIQENLELSSRYSIERNSMSYYLYFRVPVRKKEVIDCGKKKDEVIVRNVDTNQDILISHRQSLLKYEQLYMESHIQSLRIMDYQSKCRLYQQCQECNKLAQMICMDLKVLYCASCFIEHSYYTQSQTHKHRFIRDNYNKSNVSSLATLRNHGNGKEFNNQTDRLKALLKDKKHGKMAHVIQVNVIHNMLEQQEDNYQSLQSSNNDIKSNCDDGNELLRKSESKDQIIDRSISKNVNYYSQISLTSQKKGCRQLKLPIFRKYQYYAIGYQKDGVFINQLKNIFKQMQNMYVRDFKIKADSNIYDFLQFLRLDQQSIKFLHNSSLKQDTEKRVGDLEVQQEQQQVKYQQNQKQAYKQARKQKQQIFMSDNIQSRFIDYKMQSHKSVSPSEQSFLSNPDFSVEDKLILNRLGYSFFVQQQQLSLWQQESCQPQNHQYSFNEFHRFLVQFMDAVSIHTKISILFLRIQNVNYHDLHQFVSISMIKDISGKVRNDEILEKLFKGKSSVSSKEFMTNYEEEQTVMDLFWGELLQYNFSENRLIFDKKRD